MANKRIPKRKTARAGIEDAEAVNISPVDGDSVDTEEVDDQKALEDTRNALIKVALKLPFVSDEKRLTTRKISPAQRNWDKERIAGHKVRLAVSLDDMRQRFMYVIEGWASDINRYQWLENNTGIPAASWQNVMLEKQLPTLEMLLIVCLLHPHYTNWLMHGGPLDDVFGCQKYPNKELWDQYKAHREWIRKKRMKKKAEK